MHCASDVDAAGIGKFLADVRTHTGIPGIAAGVSVGGQRFTAAAGRADLREPAPLTPATHFAAGCVTKFLLAVTTLELAGERGIDLAAPLAHYLPELAGTRHGAAVRIAHLLSHTAGYLGVSLFDPGARELDWPAFATLLRARPRQFAPGRVFSYEHSETVLLGRVLAAATGSDPLTLVARRLLAPLGIAPPASSPRRAGHHVPVGPGAFRSVDPPRQARFWRCAFSDIGLSLDDLLTLGDAVARAPEAGGSVSPATVERLTRPVVELPPAVGGPFSELLPTGYALGAAVLGDAGCAASGVSFGQCLGLRWLPARGITVAVALNARLPHVRDLILASLVRALGVIERRPARPRLAVDQLRALAGNYRGAGGAALGCRFEAGRLHCRIGHPGRQGSVEAVLGVAADGTLELDCRAPQVAIGILDAARAGAPGLMLGLSAYRLRETAARA